MKGWPGKRYSQEFKSGFHTKIKEKSESGVKGWPGKRYSQEFKSGFHTKPYLINHSIQNSSDVWKKKRHFKQKIG